MEKGVLEPKNINEENLSQFYDIIKTDYVNFFSFLLFYTKFKTFKSTF